MIIITVIIIPPSSQQGCSACFMGREELSLLLPSQGQETQSEPGCVPGSGLVPPRDASLPTAREPERCGQQDFAGFFINLGPDSLLK